MRRLLWLALSFVMSTSALIVVVTGGAWAESDVHPGEGATTVASEAVEVPPGYTISVVATGLRNATSMALLPDGDFLVTLKGTGVGTAGRALVRRVHRGMVQDVPALSLSVNTTLDSGLLGMLLDPDFAENRYLYLWYSTGENARGWSGQTVDRLSRFRYDPASGTINPASEVFILDGVTWSSIHNGGGLLFDGAGNLFVTTGDANDNSSNDAVQSQDMTSLNGKVLRIRPGQNGYSVPGDNPYVGVADVRPEIYASGLRNPFRITQRQSDGAIFVADVGASAWEEVNLLQPAANYGWPIREGPCPFFVLTQPCEPTPPQFTDPVLYYSHGQSLDPSSITALLFVESDAFPPDMQGKLLYSDYSAKNVYSATILADGFTIEPFATDVGRIVDMKMGAKGLYLLDFQGGRILLIEAGGGSNQAPTARLSAGPTLGRAPLTVAFSAEDSSDDDNFGLTYRWDFGDGSEPITTTRPTTSHRYNADGNYRARLTVIDRFGAESETVEVLITVYSGVLPQIVLENLTEPGRERYHGGDRFRYAVERRVGNHGLDAKMPFRWTVELLHNTHAHPDIVDHVATEGEYEITTQAHDLNAHIRYRFSLTMRTAEGIEVTVSRDLQPQYVGLLVETWPAPHTVFVNSAPIPSGTNLAAIAGESYTLQAPQEIIYGDVVGEFAYWLVVDGWPPVLPGIEQGPQFWYSRTFTITVPISDTAFIAHYTNARPVEQSFVPIMRSILTVTQEKGKR